MIQDENIVKINIDSLMPSTYQPRKIFDANSLNELAESIKEYGILNPILVRKVNEKYEIIAGERRVRAAKICGLTEVPAIIKNVEENKLASIALTENIQRENINPIEEAKSYKKILEETKITELELSKIIGKSQAFISNRIRLLSLPDEIIDAIANKKISERHGRTLLCVKDKDKQLELLNRTINEKLSVKELENIINDNEITEAEIQDAISSILKNLEIDKDNQKEEKESENMNNESFFPNFNGVPAQNEAPVTLNSMNMQTVTPGPVPAAPIEEPAIPAASSPIPEFGVNAVEPAPVLPPVMTEPTPVPPVAQVLPVMETPVPAAPIEEPIIPTPEPTLPVLETVTTPEVTPSPIPEPVQMPAGETPLFDPNLAAPVNNDVVADIPLFTEQNVAPHVEPAPVLPPVMPEPTPTIPSAPVTPIVEPATPEVAPAPVFEPAAPVAAPTPEPTTVTVPVMDKLETVEEFLKNNNVEYKLYSNEEKHCIIIEI